MKPRDIVIALVVLMALAIAYLWVRGNGWKHDSELKAIELQQAQRSRQAAIDSMSLLLVRQQGDSAIARADSAASLRDLINQRNPQEEVNQLIHESRDLDGPAMRRDLLRPS